MLDTLSGVRFPWAAEVKYYEARGDLNLPEQLLGLGYTVTVSVQTLALVGVSLVLNMELRWGLCSIRLQWTM